jgi:hypothetical protein
MSVDGAGFLEAERERLKSQARLDAHTPPQHRNRLGQFATPPDLALQVVQLAAEHLGGERTVRFLDPALGTGVFYGALGRTVGAGRIEQAVGYEIDTATADIASGLWGMLGLDARCGDFLGAMPSADEAHGFNLLVCNPPYSRHHHLDRVRKRELQQLVAQHLGLRISGLAGVYCHFVLLASRWLTEAGVAAWLLPAEFLDVNYGAALRSYLTTQVSVRRIHRFAPEDMQFADALVTSCVVVLEASAPVPEGPEVALSSGGTLSAPARVIDVPLAVLRDARKWGPLIEGGPHAHLTAERGAAQVGEFFEIRRGIATGANSFFVVPVEQARSRGLPEGCLLPVLPSPRLVPGDLVQGTADGWPGNTARLALVACDLPRQSIRRLYPALDAYLGEAEAAGLTDRYLLRSRRPWYRQERRPPAPILCTYMGRTVSGRPAIRFIRNESEATALNVYLMLYPKPSLVRAMASDSHLLDRVFEALQRIPPEALATNGRVYGGGLRKLEPAELGRLPLRLAQEDEDRLRQACQPSLFG